MEQAPAGALEISEPEPAEVVPVEAVAPRQIRVNLDNLTWGSMRQLDRFLAGENLTRDELYQLLSPMVEGGIDDIPINQTGLILTEISRAVAGRRNPNG